MRLIAIDGVLDDLVCTRVKDFIHIISARSALAELDLVRSIFCLGLIVGGELEK